MTRGRKPSPRVTIVCAECAQPFIVPEGKAARRYCGRTCSNRAVNRASGEARRIRHATDIRVRRAQRESAAPGLTQSERKTLLARWKRQGRACAYCTSLATTIDHVLPLIRGGTNYEGNLAPACRHCNSSKSGHTIIEWRTGLRLPPMWSTVPHAPREFRACAHCGRTYTSTAWNSVYCSPKCGAAHRRPARADVACPRCGVLTSRPKWCSTECWGLAQREKYRNRVGIPVDAPKWTRVA